MAWTTMHFGLGMACGGAAMAAAWAVGAVRRRGLGCGRPARWATPVMTACGVWAVVPDLPRVFREDFPSLGLASTLGSRSLDAWLLSFGDVFFFHKMLDGQPREFALHGFALTLLCYNAAWLASWLERRRYELRVGLGSGGSDEGGSVIVKGGRSQR